MNNEVCETEYIGGRKKSFGVPPVVCRKFLIPVLKLVTNKRLESERVTVLETRETEGRAERKGRRSKGRKRRDRE